MTNEGYSLPAARGDHDAGGLRQKVALLEKRIVLIEDERKRHFLWRWFEELKTSGRSLEPGRLLSHGYKLFSQNDEDGIIQEIFRRIGTTNKSLVEFGVSDGRECNTRLLLMLGWTGLWLDGSEENIRIIRERGECTLAEAALVTAENIDSILGRWAGGSANSPGEIDLLSIDIDGNDYWVWKAIESVKPRVVITEYNASYPPPIEFVIPYDPDHRWDGTNYFGASLSALVGLAGMKGYSLVGCCLAGVNAFFVRNDLLGDGIFHAPYSAEEHYEPARYEIGAGLRNGHPARFGVNGLTGR